MIASVRLGKTGLIWFLVLVWAPLVAHCQFEAISGAALFQCVPSSSESAPHGTHCDVSDCCSLEAGHYQLPSSQVLLVLESQSYDAPAVSILLVERSSDLGEVHSACFAPPELPQSWQFALRTALPIRAPSHAS